MAIEAKSIEQLLDDMSVAIADEGALVNDLNIGSNLYVLGRAFARMLADAWRTISEVERDSNLATATGESLKLLVNTFGMEPSTGTQAAGYMIALPRNPSKTGTIQPGDTFIYKKGVFVVTETTAVAVPQADSTYAVVAIQAGAAGKRWNLPGGTPMLASSKSLNDDFVFAIGDTLLPTGQAAGSLAGGEDPEDDDSIRIRFGEYIQSLTRATYSAVYQALLAIPGIKSATLLDNDPMPGFLSVYVDDGSPDATLSSTMAATIDQELMNWRAAGVGLRLLPLEKVAADIRLRVTVDRSQPISLSAVEDAVEVALADMIAGMTKGQTLYPSRLIDTAYGITGVVDVQVILPETKVVVGDQQIFRARSIVIDATA